MACKDPVMHLTKPYGRYCMTIKGATNLIFLDMEQLQIAFSTYYDVIRDNANGFEKLLTCTNRFKKK